MSFLRASILAVIRRNEEVDAYLHFHSRQNVI